MKYCKKCGVSIPDDATFCPACGARVEEDKVVDVPVIEPSKTVNTRPDQKGIETAAVVFLILGCIGNILTAYYKDPARVGYLCLIPLCWSIPMIVHAFRVFRKGERI